MDNNLQPPPPSIFFSFLYIWFENIFQVKILKHLLEHEGLDLSDKENLNIMSQYNAQCHQIRLAVSDIAENVNVNTVVASQGRFESLLHQQAKW